MIQKEMSVCNLNVSNNQTCATTQNILTGIICADFCSVLLRSSSDELSQAPSKVILSMASRNSGWAVSGGVMVAVRGQNYKLNTLQRQEIGRQCWDATHCEPADL